MLVNYVLLPLLGGVVIGIASVLYLLFNGRVSGISGILGGILTRAEGVKVRIFFVVGMILGGFLISFCQPSFFRVDLERPTSVLLIAGFLVGFGAIVGYGCTSGHGICGLGRLSLRSFVSVGVFLVVAIVTATLYGGLTP